MEELSRVAYSQSVFPLIYSSVKEYSSQHPSRWSTLYDEIVKRNLLLSAELITLLRRFREEGIEVLPFKGPVLAQFAYGDITRRQFGDLDILIHPEDFEKIAKILINRGYTPAYPIEHYQGKQRTLFELNNDCPFYDRRRGISVEIHWDFFRKLALPTKLFYPWDNPKEITINGYQIKTLCDETHLLYHSLHGSKHIWERLIWITDIDRMIRRSPHLDWEKILQQAKSLGALRMFLLGPALAQKYLDTPLPDFVSDLCHKEDFTPFYTFIEEEWQRERPTPENSLVKLRKVIDLRDNLYYKSKTLLEFLFHPGINERRMVVLPDSLFWLYWIIRPFGMGYRFLRCRLFKDCKTIKEG